MPVDPLVSVIIPVYNGEAYIAEAIDSVLQQTWRHCELIIVDDGSTDRTANIAKSYGTKLLYHHQNNQWQGAARNKGVSLSRGEFIAFLDADDLWLADKLTQQMAALQQHLDVAMAFSLMELFHSPELSDERKQNHPNDGQIVMGISQCAMLIRRDAFLRVGAFPTQVRLGEFISWYARAKDMGLQQLMLDQVLVKRRLHNYNTSGLYRHEQQGYLKVLKEIVDRRRNS